MNLDGHCLCGQVTYTCETEPKFTALCHCTDCQRQTGGSASLVVGVDDGDLHIEGDSLRVFVTVGDEHKTNTNRSFCSNCGSPICGRIDAMPGLAFLKAGTLNDRSWLNPTVEVWTRSAQPWMTAIAGADRYEGDLRA
jgi:hypothetical protein